MKLLTCWMFSILLLTSTAFATDNLGYKTFKFHEKKLNCDITGEYPQFYSSQISTNSLQKLNSEVRKFTNGIFEKFLNEDDIGKQIKADLKTDDEGDAFDIHYKIVRADSKYVSILFDTYYMPTGGAHGVLYYYALNYNIEHLKVIQLKDLFIPGTNYLKQMNYFSNIELTKQLGKDFVPMDAFSESDQFVFDQKNLIIQYDTYEVASYSSGSPKITIPLNKLKGLKI